MILETFYIVILFGFSFFLFYTHKKVKKPLFALLVPISAGELFDKIAILEIKKEMIKDEEKQKIVLRELKQLNNIKKDFIGIPSSFDFNDYYKELYDINLKLWHAEEKFRTKDQKKEYDEEFIECAKLDILLNDKRFVVKRKINDFFDSQIKEVKSYKEEILNRT